MKLHAAIRPLLTLLALATAGGLGSGCTSTTLEG